MRVLVAGLAVSTQPSGVCRHAANLVRCLLSRREVTKVNFVVGAWAHEYFGELVNSSDGRLEISIASATNASSARNLWYYRELPKLATTFQADVVHATYPVPIRRSGFTGALAVTLHDLYPYDIPENFGYPKVLVNRLILHHSLHSADAICCVSQNTLNRLSDRWPSLNRKAFRVYNCVEQGPSSEVAPLPELARDPFLLMVAQHRRNKNIPLALKVFRNVVETGTHPFLKLLIVGNDGPETEHIHSLLRRLKLTERVVVMNGLSDEALQWCYQHCGLLLSTSTIEGFGLPVAEAVLAGCRVVCSDLPVFREVSRDLCRFVPLAGHAETSFTNEIIAALEGCVVRPIALPQFSMDAVADDYLNVYRQLVSPRISPQSSALEATRGKFAQEGRLQ